MGFPPPGSALPHHPPREGEGGCKPCSHTNMKRISPQQRQASDPAASVWVNANAGSGKTTVLTARVVRLMLEGANPARILCVTFTKAAAANMQDRIFKQLGEWVALPTADLAAAVEEMTGAAPNAVQLVQARRLFAHALETPGGLKIQTIHSFAERLLHQFPFESGVPARFKPMEEAEATELMAQSVNITLRAGLDAPRESGLRLAFDICTQEAGEESFREALKLFVAHHRQHGAAPERKFNISPLRSKLGVAHGETVADVERTIWDGSLLVNDSEAIIAWLRSGSANDVKLATKLGQVLETSGAPSVELYVSCFIADKGTPRASLATDKTAKRNLEFNARLLAEQGRVAALFNHRKSVATALRTEAVAELAAAVHATYAALKRQKGALDFTDLIDRAVRLLTSNAAAWVRYKLDQGLDHVLVDEAQDTSPQQWAIIKALTDDFHSGEGARGLVRRTVFAVGDEKQSIFGFQGARPESFSEARAHFEKQIERYNRDAPRKLSFQSVPLVKSYRTVPDVLNFVDHVFSAPERYAGLQSEDGSITHETDRQRQPGLVELWPLIQDTGVETREATDPVDAAPEQGHESQLAQRIAEQISFWLKAGAHLHATGKTIGPGDILVLVRNRSAIFHACIRALKQAGLPVAGADRMRLTESIAVRDLLALGRAALLPGDDLTLAALLRSPLLGLSEEEIYALAQGRGLASLRERLDASAVPRCAEAARKLTRWCDLARRLDPFAFYAQVLGREEGRSLLLARLGAEAAEALDVFMARLRQWQAGHPPALIGFLEAMAADEGEVKRDMEEGHGRVRVMTVHGSKGLEAPIVFLADTCHDPLNGGKGAKLLELETDDALAADGLTAAWLPRKTDDPPQATEARTEEVKQALAESRRLLYVAMTRAKDRLYIGAACGVRNPPTECWHLLIKDAVTEAAAQLEDAPSDTGQFKVLRWRTPEYTAKAAEGAPQAWPEVTLPDWLRVSPELDEARPPPLRPSRLVDAAEAPRKPEQATLSAPARIRGEAIHLLLQHLPGVQAVRRDEVAGRLLAARFPALDESESGRAIRETLALMARPELAGLFEGDARTEVAIAGRVAYKGRQVDVSGRIDRLVVAAGHVTLIDFKTGRPPDDPAVLPPGVIAQIVVYSQLVANLYSGRRISALVIWTQIGRAVSVPLPETLPSFD